MVIQTRKNNVDDMKKAMDTYLLNPELASTHAGIGHKNLSRFSLDTSAQKYLTK